MVVVAVMVVALWSFLWVESGRYRLYSELDRLLGLVTWLLKA